MLRSPESGVLWSDQILVWDHDKESVNAEQVGRAQNPANAAKLPAINKFVSLLSHTTKGSMEYALLVIFL